MIVKLLTANYALFISGSRPLEVFATSCKAFMSLRLLALDDFHCTYLVAGI